MRYENVTHSPEAPEKCLSQYDFSKIDWGAYETNLLRAQLKNLNGEWNIAGELVQRAKQLVELYETLFPKLQTINQVFDDYRKHLLSCQARLDSMRESSMANRSLPESLRPTGDSDSAQLLLECHAKAVTNEKFFGIVELYWNMHTSMILVLENVLRNSRELVPVVSPLLRSIRASGQDAPQLFSLIAARPVEFTLLPEPDGERAQAEATWNEFLQANATNDYIRTLKPHEQRPGIKRLIFFCIGGMGDALLQTPVVAAINAYFSPCEILFIHSRPVVTSIFDGNNSVAAALYANDSLLLRLIPAVKSLRVFDIVLESRFLIWAELCRDSRVTDANELSWITKTQDYAEPFKPYLGRFPHYSNLFARLMRPKMLLDVHGMSTGLDVSVSSPLLLFPNASDATFTRELKIATSEYVTVHDGFDESFGKQMGITRCTKQLPIETWRNLVLGLKRKGMKVVQVGSKNEPQIPDVDYDLRGKTTISQLGHVLKAAVIHIDTEGGIVHMARAVHKRSIVFFGPTSVSFWGYPWNINITSREYADCWWISADWMARTPIRQKQLPMDAIDVRKVPEIVEQLKNESSKISFSINYSFQFANAVSQSSFLSCLNTSLGRHRVVPQRPNIHSLEDFVIPSLSYAFHSAVLDNIVGMLISNSTPRILIIGESLPKLPQALGLLGAIVEHTHTRFPDGITLSSEPMALTSCSYRRTYSSPFNLAANSNEYDAVICYDLHSWANGEASAVAEMLRLLRTNGSLHLLAKSDNLPAVSNIEDIGMGGSKDTRGLAESCRDLCGIIFGHTTDGTVSCVSATPGVSSSISSDVHYPYTVISALRIS